MNAGSARCWVAVAMMVALSLVGLPACRSSSDAFDIDVPPPTGRETYAEVLPAQLGGADADIETLQLVGGRLHGIRASYAGKVLIEIVQSPVAADLDGYADNLLRRQLAAYGTVFGGKTQGRWLLTVAGGGGRALAWQNRDWMFLLAGSDQAAFDEAVEKFAFIGRR